MRPAIIWRSEKVMSRHTSDCCCAGWYFLRKQRAARCNAEMASPVGARVAFIISFA